MIDNLADKCPACGHDTGVNCLIGCVALPLLLGGGWLGDTLAGTPGMIVGTIVGLVLGYGAVIRLTRGLRT